MQQPPRTTAAERVAAHDFAAAVRPAIHESELGERPTMPASKRSISGVLAITLGSLLASGLVAAPAYADTPTMCADTSSQNGRIAGCMVATRAQDWINDGVTYSTSSTHDGYRTDCSGYVSWALNLSQPGLVSGAMYEANGFVDVAKDSLQQGDILTNPSAGSAGHVVLFDHWTDSTHTSYWGFENTGGGNVGYHTIPYPYWSGAGTFYPQHYTNLATGTPPAPTVAAQGAANSGTVTLTASDTDPTVSTMTFYVDGTVIGSTTSSPFSLSWNTTAYPNGTHQVTAVATNARGNSPASASAAYVVNNVQASATALGSKSSDGTFATYFRGTDNNLWSVSDDTNGAWRNFDFTTAVPGTPAATGKPVGEKLPDGTFAAFYRGTDGNLWSVSDDSSGAWHSFNFTGATGAPAVVGNPVGQKLSDGTFAVFYQGTDGDLWSVSDDTSGAWHKFDFTTAVPGTPKPSGDVVGEKLADGTFAAFFRGTDGNLWSVSDDASGAWHSFNFTGATGAPAVVGNPVGQKLSDGTFAVFYQGSDGDLWSVSDDTSGAWHKFDFTTAVPGTPKPSGDVVGEKLADGTFATFFRGTDGNLWSVSDDASGAWHSFNFTGATGAPAVVGDPVGQKLADGTFATFYQGSDGDLWSVSDDTSGAWHKFDFTTAVPGTPKMGS
ncbi:Ig-like domain-containing protein [Kitasatospora sp. LaBMicrA B282]|uniref:Ig-like domain-containing protein n=1 Tax=Kitasatospora sp. LaBMicrA B282 TaxID=3420949 RepID=UPI003D0D0E83